MVRRILVLVSVLLIATVSFASAAIELKLAHAAPETDVQQSLAKFFAEEVSKRTKGEVVIKIYPHGQLGNDQQMINGVRSGIIDIEMSGLNNFDGIMPEVGGVLLPYIFTDRQHAFRVLDGEVGKDILKNFEKFGMKGLGFPENGFRNITNSRRPIKTPADVAGLKIRTNNSKALNEMFAMLKANPQPLPVSELYTALETGVVDAQEHPIPITFSFRYDEVQKYLSLTEHSYATLVIVMNLKKFNGLKPEYQKVILDVAKEAVDYQRKLCIASEADVMKELEKRGMKINKDVDKAAFQKAVAKTWDSYISKYGDSMIKKIEAAKTAKAAK